MHGRGLLAFVPVDIPAIDCPADLERWIHTVPVEGRTMDVVAGLMDTPDARAAMGRAAEEAQLRGGTLHLVAFLPSPETNSDDSPSNFAAERDRFQALLDERVEAYRAKGIDCAGHLPLGASRPSQAILEVAEVVGAGLVVIGMRRRSRVGKLVLGSNAQDIVLGADCAVLAIKAIEEDV